MNKYNIKVGDYVETWDGAVGYVTITTSEAFAFDIKIDGEKFKRKEGQYLWYPSYCLFDKENVIKQIGANDFSKKENKFEPINKYNSSKDYTEIKINELIDHINAI